MRSGPDIDLHRGVHVEPPKQKIHYELRVDDKVDNPLEYPPLDLHDAGRGQLLMSPKLVTCLNDLAVDNVQYIPAEAVYVPSRAVVPYQLGNILGLVKALDVAASDCEVDEDGFVEYVVSHLGDAPEVYATIRKVNMGWHIPTHDEAMELEVGRNECALSG